MKNVLDERLLEDEKTLLTADESISQLNGRSRQSKNWGGVHKGGVAFFR
jgi:hypothetical protein